MSSIDWIGPTTASTSDEVSTKRRVWVSIVNCLTCCVSGQDSEQMAYKEKLALCIIIAVMNVVFVCVMPFVSLALCPQMLAEFANPLVRMEDLQMATYLSGKGLVVKYGIVYDETFNSQDRSAVYANNGLDVSPYPRTDSLSFQQCTQVQNDRINKLRQMQFRSSGQTSGFVPSATLFKRPVAALKYYRWELGEGMVVIGSRVYNLTEYFSKGYSPFFDQQTEAQLSKGVVSSQLPIGVQECLDQLFYVGQLSQEETVGCTAANGAIGVVFMAIMTLVLFKFLSALKLPQRSVKMRNIDRGIICFVPVYTEGENMLRKSLESILASQSVNNLMLFIVCDGMIIGDGNKLSSVSYVLDILQHKATKKPEMYKYESLSGVSEAQLYSGKFKQVPYVVVSKQYNQGKRDSQVLLMKFLNKCYFNSAMSPLEVAVREQMEELNVDQQNYDYCFMADSDTQIDKQALYHLANVLRSKRLVMGVTGTTNVSNPLESFISCIQVHEYFNSHHLNKAFESLFSTVSCMPGCFSMWRIKDTKRNIPLLVSQDVMLSYEVRQVDTLHDKNLLLLGEDRYLTTLMLKNFPGLQTKYTPHAHCMTTVPSEWRVFLSQRRRWINSTVHNLFDLMQVGNLCGFCCVGMRFVVFLDLFGTLLLPGSFIYIIYFIIQLIVYPIPPYSALLLLACILGSQVLIILSTGQIKQLLYLIPNILMFPVYNFILPIYAFSQFNDFKWGSTRVVDQEYQVSKMGFVKGGQAGSRQHDQKIELVKWSDRGLKVSTKIQKSDRGLAPVTPLSADITQEAI